MLVCQRLFGAQHIVAHDFDCLSRRACPRSALAPTRSEDPLLLLSPYLVGRARAYPRLGHHANAISSYPRPRQRPYRQGRSCLPRPHFAFMLAGCACPAKHQRGRKRSKGQRASAACWRQTRNASAGVGARGAGQQCEHPAAARRRGLSHGHERGPWRKTKKKKSFTLKSMSYQMSSWGGSFGGKCVRLAHAAACHAAALRDISRFRSFVRLRRAAHVRRCPPPRRQDAAASQDSPSANAAGCRALAPKVSEAVTATARMRTAPTFSSPLRMGAVLLAQPSRLTPSLASCGRVALWQRG